MRAAEILAALLIALLLMHWLTAGHDEVSTTCVSVYVNGTLAERPTCEEVGR